MGTRDSQTAKRSIHPACNSIERRRFVTLFGAALAATACGRPVQAILEPANPGGRKAGLPSSTTIVNVRDFGAVGDGATNDTAAINAAIRSLGATGGTVSIPDGAYQIDPVVSIKLASNVALVLSQNAVLNAIPTRSAGSAVVLLSGITNAQVSGGRIIGERVAHLGTTGEWGMGIQVMGSSSISISNVDVSDCWGDGFYIGALGPGRESRNVTLTSCVGRNNRRQGLSITGCITAVVEDCQFTDTNGTAPSAGIDLEPNAGLRVTDIIVRRCELARNAGYGLLLVGASVTDVTLESNRCTDNSGPGIDLMRGVSGTVIRWNTIERNNTYGVLFEGAHYNDIAENAISDNSAGTPDAFPNIRLATGSSHNTIVDNKFGLTRLLNVARADIEITPDCSDNTVLQAVIKDSGIAQKSTATPRSRSR